MASVLGIYTTVQMIKRDCLVPRSSLARDRVLKRTPHLPTFHTYLNIY